MIVVKTSSMDPYKKESFSYINLRDQFKKFLQLKEDLPTKTALFSTHVVRCASALGFHFSFLCNMDLCKT